MNNIFKRYVYLSQITALVLHSYSHHWSIIGIIQVSRKK